MAIRNTVRLIGNMGKDPKLIVMESGTKMVRFPLATHEQHFSAKGERRWETSWHTIIAFGKTADFIHRRLAKGTEVSVEGKLTYRRIHDDQAGERFITEIVVSEILSFGRP